MRYIFVLLFTFLTLKSISQTVNKFEKKDEKILSEMPVKWEHWWNIHNMDSMGTLLRDDIDFVTIAGTWLKGKREAVELHKKNHETIFKTSKWTTDSVALRFIKPDVAIIHIKWGISGDFDPDGTPRNPRHGIFTWIATKENNEWLLLAVHNVNVREAVSK